MRRARRVYRHWCKAESKGSADEVICPSRRSGEHGKDDEEDKVSGGEQCEDPALWARTHQEVEQSSSFDFRALKLEALANRTELDDSGNWEGGEANYEEKRS